MKIINLSIYGTDMIDILPILINKERVLLIRRDFFMNNENYLEYNTQRQLLLPIPIHQDERKGIIKIIKSGLSDSFLYHAILEDNSNGFDIVGLYRLSSQENKIEKIMNFKVYKDNHYRNFNDFTNSYAWIDDLQDNKVFIRLNNNKGIEYFYKDFDTGYLKEIKMEYMKDDIRYFGRVKDEAGIYYVFRTGDESSVEDRKFFSHFVGLEKADRVRDKIIVVRKEDLENLQTLTNDNFILIDKADINEGIGGGWIVNNRIYYIKEDITEDRVEHFVFDFENKVRSIITNKTTRKVPIVDKSNLFYYTHEDDQLNVFDEDFNTQCKIPISGFYERVEKFFSRYVVIGSLSDPFVKKVYEINTGKCVGEYCGKVFEYFEDEDTLVIC